MFPLLNKCSHSGKFGCMIFLRSLSEGNFFLFTSSSASSSVTTIDCNEQRKGSDHTANQRRHSGQLSFTGTFTNKRYDTSPIHTHTHTESCMEGAGNIEGVWATAVIEHHFSFCGCHRNSLWSSTKIISSSSSLDDWPRVVNTSASAQLISASC